MAGENINIVDRVVERLKASPLGDLITEEDLHDIVKQAIPKTFFAERKITEGSGYHERVTAKPPLIVEVMSELLRAEAQKAVKDWLDANPQIITDYWKQVCDEKLLSYVQAIQNEQATASVKMALNAWVGAINNERSKQGLPMMFLGI